MLAFLPLNRRLLRLMALPGLAVLVFTGCKDTTRFGVEHDANRPTIVLETLPASERTSQEPIGGSKAHMVAQGEVEASSAQIKEILSELNAKQVGASLHISLPEKILFDFDKATLRPEARKPIQKLAKLAAHYSGSPIRIEGHTDSKGADSYNQTLSQRRAEAVKQALGEWYGVAFSRLSAKGCGESKPVAANSLNGKDNPEGRQANRRVEVIIEQATESE